MRSQQISRKVSSAPKLEAGKLEAKESKQLETAALKDMISHSS